MDKEHDDTTHEPVRGGRLALPRWSVKMWVGFSLAALVAAGITVRLTYYYLSQSPIPPAVAEQALFETYYPYQLPQGYQLDENSYHNTEGALVFSASNEGGGRLAITETARPKDYDMDAFYNGLTNSRKVINRPYTVVAGEMPGRGTILSILAHDTWIIVSCNKSLNEADLRMLAGHWRR